MHTKLFETDKIVPFCLPSDIANYGAAVKYAARLTECCLKLKETYEPNEDTEEVISKMKATEYYLHELLGVIAEADMAYQGKPMSKEGRLHQWGILQGFKKELLNKNEEAK